MPAAICPAGTFINRQPVASPRTARHPRDRPQARGRARPAARAARRSDRTGRQRGPGVARQAPAAARRARSPVRNARGKPRHARHRAAPRHRQGLPQGGRADHPVNRRRFARQPRSADRPPQPGVGRQRNAQWRAILCSRRAIIDCGEDTPRNIAAALPLFGEPLGQPCAGTTLRREPRPIAHDRACVAPTIGLHDRRQTFSCRKVILRHPDPY